MFAGVPSKDRDADSARRLRKQTIKKHRACTHNTLANIPNKEVDRTGEGL